MGEQPSENSSDNHAGDSRGGPTSRAMPGVTCEEFEVLRSRARQEGDSTAGDSSAGISPMRSESQRDKLNSLGF